ncbi:DNA-binding IclR family transcriptional regulator [Roseinatronobacter thiooxidans]|uniref:DNA-binding IclR family transcriptional regulator n=1 Tax=Roseinatronobacter thiooxidans TaxID=121821 RepID=A0A2W7PLG3_9RHOB|nr:helix-turn-helix domain-containing protein [Roseinatronobacter thiooxidans]PZX37028.1 DNA-binding IclR family transcriptional regulator [Roseinatronobacter thiooxidans]
MPLEDSSKSDAQDISEHNSPTLRLLLVFEAIGTHGPITLKHLADILPIHRSSIWRATNTLKARGWVRMRLGDHAFELTGRLGTLLTDFHFAAADIDGAAGLIHEIVQVRSLHVEFCQFVATGKFVMIESSYRSVEREGLRSLVSDSAALAAQIAMSAPERDTHLDAYCKQASEIEREIIASGEHQKTLRNYANTGVVWNTDLLAVSLPWIGASGTFGAMTIISKSSTKKAADELEQFARYLVRTHAHGARAEVSGF